MDQMESEEDDDIKWIKISIESFFFSFSIF